MFILGAGVFFVLSLVSTNLGVRRAAQLLSRTAQDGAYQLGHMQVESDDSGSSSPVIASQAIIIQASPVAVDLRSPSYEPKELN